MSPDQKKYVAAPVWFGYGGTKLPGPHEKDCVLIDLDGTMLNNEHRQHHMKTSPPSWGPFFAAMDLDTAYQPVRWLANLIFMHSAVDVILVTGRPSQYHKATLEVLHDEGCNFTALIMRAQTDNRSDVAVKLDMLEGIKLQGLKPILVIDDRPEVVAMWRQQGILCLQADPRGWEVVDYDELTMRALIDENERLRARVEQLEVAGIGRLVDLGHLRPEDPGVTDDGGPYVYEKGVKYHRGQNPSAKKAS